MRELVEVFNELLLMRGNNWTAPAVYPFFSVIREKPLLIFRQILNS